MSLKRKDLILFDYDYLYEYQTKEEILDNTLSNLFEKLTLNKYFILLEYQFID